MKRTLSKLLALVLLINIIIPTKALAQNILYIYNCGERVDFYYSPQERDGKLYIHTEELCELCLEVEDNVIYNRDKELTINPGSSSIKVNDILMLYQCPAIVYKGDTYVSLDLIAMLFSPMYEINGNDIMLWITYTSPYNFVRGTVSLPDGLTAPEGGTSVKVFVTERESTASGSSASAVLQPQLEAVGLKGEKKPSYADYSLCTEYKKSVEKTVIIPEGSSCADFYLYTTEGRFTGARVGYSAKFEGYTYGEVLLFDRKLESYDFKMDNAITYISGRVTVPEPRDKDIAFTVVAEGKSGDGYTYRGVINAGSGSADYSMLVASHDSYSMLVFFEDGEYKRTRRQATVVVEDMTASNINLNAEPADSYTVTLSLPADYDAEESITARVYIQSAVSPYYYLDSEAITIPLGEKSASVVLYDDMAEGKIICCYELSDDYEGLYAFGHYGAGGVTFDVSNAKQINASDSTVEIPMLKTKEFTAAIALPDNEAAKNDVYVDIEPVIASYPIYDAESMRVVSALPKEEGDDVNYLPPLYESNEKNEAAVGADIRSSAVFSATVGSASGVGGGGVSGGGTTAVSGKAAPTIAKGEKKGIVKIIIPDEADYGYRLEVRVKDAASAYYRKIYYNSKKSTAVIKNASVINTTNTNTDISIELMKQHLISGNVNAVGYTDCSNRIFAIGQKSQDTRADVQTSDFFAYTDIYGNGSYGLFVPDEFDDYILKLHSYYDGDSVYYAKPKAVDNIEASELLTISEDTEDIDFDYDGFLPSPPITLEASNIGDAWNISMCTAGDFDIDNVMCRIALYDKKGRLLLLKQSSDELTVKPSKTAKTSIEVSAEDIAEAETVKLFAWSDMKPVSEAYYIKKPRTSMSEEKIALLYAKAGESVIYSEGVPYNVGSECLFIDECAYLPLRAGAEALAWTIYWDDASQLITIVGNNHTGKFTVDKLTAVLDGKAVEISAPFKLTDGRAMAPIAEIAELFGYTAVTNNSDKSVAVYDKLNSLILETVRYGIVSEKFDSCMLDDDITRSQMASLIVHLYEKIKGEIIVTEEKTFTDTNDTEMLKTYETDLMNGYEDGSFKPGHTVTNAEMITLVQRTLEAVGAEIPTDFSSTQEFDNFPKNSSHWAAGYIYGMKTMGMLQYVFGDTIEPDSNADIRSTLAVFANYVASL